MTWYYPEIPVSSQKISYGDPTLIWKPGRHIPKKFLSTSPPQLLTQIMEVVNHSLNSIMTFTENFTASRWIFCISRIYYLSQKIPERCEDSDVDYRISYKKALLFITIEINWPIVYTTQLFANYFKRKVQSQF